MSFCLNIYGTHSPTFHNQIEWQEFCAPPFRLIRNLVWGSKYLYKHFHNSWQSYRTIVDKNWIEFFNINCCRLKVICLHVFQSSRLRGWPSHKKDVLEADRVSTLKSHSGCGVWHAEHESSPKTMGQVSNIFPGHQSPTRCITYKTSSSSKWNILYGKKTTESGSVLQQFEWKDLQAEIWQ